MRSLTPQAKTRADCYKGKPQFVDIHHVVGTYLISTNRVDEGSSTMDLRLSLNVFCWKFKNQIHIMTVLRGWSLGREIRAREVIKAEHSRWMS